jgi:hypothetical protein
MLTRVLADLVDRHDPGVIEVGCRLGLGVEPLDVAVVGELTGDDHLEGDGAIEADLAGVEDHAHAAPGDLADDLVVAEIADGRAGRKVARRPVAIGRLGQPAEVGGPVGGGVGVGRSRARSRLVGRRPVGLGVSRCRLGRVVCARGREAGCGVGRSGWISDLQPAHRATGAEVRRSVRGEVRPTIRAMVRVGSHGGESVGNIAVPS